MAQLVYFAVGSWLEFDSRLNGPVYVAVGAAMGVAGYLILYDRLPHWHPLMWISNKDRLKHANEKTASKRVPIHWCIIHGFIAGFGVDTGLFTTFVYLVAVPSMPSYLLGFAPGAAFGLGTLLVLLVIGTVFGGVLQIANRWGTERVQLFGSRVGARSLLFGGLIFIAAGLLYVVGLSSALPVDFGNFVVVIFMVVVIVPVMYFTWREVRAMPISDKREQYV